MTKIINTTLISAFLFLALGLSSTNVHAYIPKLNTILGKMTANNGGTKTWVLKRTVTLKEDNVVAQETWTVANADLMKVRAEGTNPDGSAWAVEVLYKGGRRHTTTSEGNAQVFPLSAEFFEPLIHYRSARALMSRLSALQILPPNVSGDSSSPGFANLDRYKGGVAYMLGALDSKNTLQPPRLWVEQDSFLIRKLRLGSQVEVEFDSYKDFEEKKIKQPELQTVFWKSTTVLIQNTSTQLLDAKKTESALQIQKGMRAVLPVNTNLKEFYSRFR